MISNRLIWGCSFVFVAGEDIESNDDKLKDMEISTVDDFQGREKEAIIISMANECGCDTETVSSAGFLRRLIEYFEEQGENLSASDQSTSMNKQRLLVKRAVLNCQIIKSFTGRCNGFPDKLNYSCQKKSYHHRKQLAWNCSKGKRF
ncbi:hypothetical protein OIU79_028679 [Salix purpurea]|uniref:DNA2/NAM7 helicase-like C-terminal domain-containing protein n=1 Tax=Salix purpurea TaxID=77065 RepID=A0A9Q0VZ36_SALPP|nr:hypothetical protein OIU79_028679 [Salix purpurea]